MGDRGNIVIEKDGRHFKEPLFFYTHWNGYCIKETLQAALKRGQGRWDDPSYLARIIFSEMIQNSVMEDTGFGISNILCDNERDLLCVDIANKTVRLREENNDASGTIIKEWSFSDFLKESFDEEE